MNKFESERRFAERMKRCYPPGTRLLLLSMDDPYAPIDWNKRHGCPCGRCCTNPYGMG